MYKNCLNCNSYIRVGEEHETVQDCLEQLKLDAENKKNWGNHYITQWINLSDMCRKIVPKEYLEKLVPFLSD